MKHTFFISTIALSTILFGCGEETPPHAITAPDKTIKASEEAQIDGQFRALCVDAKAPTITSLINDCNAHNVQFGSSIDCAAHGALLTGSLNAEWDSILLSAHADLTFCRADYRVSEDYCLANFSLSLSRDISACESIVITTLIY